MRRKQEVSPTDRYLTSCKLFLRTVDIQLLVGLGKKKAQVIFLELKKKEAKEYNYMHSVYAIRTSLVLDYFKIDRGQLYLQAVEYEQLIGGISNGLPKPTRPRTAS